LTELQMVVFSYIQLKKVRWPVTFGKRMTPSKAKLQFQIGQLMEDSFLEAFSDSSWAGCKQLEGLPVHERSFSMDHYSQAFAEPKLQ